MGLLDPVPFPLSDNAKKLFGKNSPTPSPEDQATMQETIGVTEALDAVEDGITEVEIKTNTLEGNVGALNTRVTSVEQAQANGHKGYLTQALLFADLAPAENTLAEVTNDANISLNGTYIKIGGTGTGSWQLSTNGLYADVADLKYKTSSLSISTASVFLPDGRKLVLTFRDENGRVAAGITDQGEWISVHSHTNATTSAAGFMSAADKSQLDINTSNVGTNTANIATNTSNIATNTSNIGALQTAVGQNQTSIAQLQVKTSSLSVSTESIYIDGVESPTVLVVKDEMGRVALAITADGVFRVTKAKISEIEGNFNTTNIETENIEADNVVTEDLTVGGNLFEVRTDKPGYVFIIADAAGRIAFGIKNDGSPVIPGLVIPGASPNSITTEMLVDGAVTTAKQGDGSISTPKLDLTLRRYTGNDLVASMPDDVRPQLSTIGLRSSQDWIPLSEHLTPIVWGVNTTNTSLEFKRNHGLLIRGLRRFGTFDPGSLDSTLYRGSISDVSAWPPAGTFATGDYYKYGQTTPRVIGSDTLQLGDLMVYNGSSWVYQAGPGSGSTKYELDWWEVTAAGIFDGVNLNIGDRMVYLGRQSASGTLLLRWRKGRPDYGEFFIMGTFDPASGLPTSPSEGDMWEASANGTAGAFTFIAGDLLIRTGSTWGIINDGTTKSFASGSVIILPCTRSSREWMFRRVDRSLTRVNLTLSTRGLRKYHHGNSSVLVIGDSMAAQPGTGLVSLIAPRTVTTRSYGGGTSRDVLTMAEYLIDTGDPDSGKTVIGIHGQNSAGDPGQIQEVTESLTRLCNTTDQRIIHVSMLGVRALTWNGSRLVSANHEEQLVPGSTNIYAKHIQYLKASWPDQYLDFRKILCDAALSDNDPSIQFPGMTNAEVAAVYGIPPVKWCRSIEPSNGLSYCVNYLGTWSDPGLPTGGNSGDYYIRIANGTVGFLQANINGVWTNVTYDTIHLNTEGDSKLSAAIAAELNSKNW